MKVLQTAPSTNEPTLTDVYLVRYVGVMFVLKAGLYRNWCGVHRLGDTSAFVNPAGQLLLIAINSGLIAEWMASA